MSDFENWDIDEDFLKGIEDDATAFYSQNENAELLLPKRHKLDLDNNPFSSDMHTPIQNDMNNVNKQSCRLDGTSRKNFILGSLKQKHLSMCNTDISSKKTKSIENTVLSGHDLNNKHNDSQCASRKQFVRSILEKKNSQNEINKSMDLSSGSGTVIGHNIVKSDTKYDVPENTFSIQDEDFIFDNGIGPERFSEEDSENLPNHVHSKRYTSRQELTTLTSNVQSPANLVQQMAVKDSVKSVRNVSQIQPVFSFQKQGEQPEQTFKQCNKVTLPRKFAGPAGLLPDASHGHSTVPFYIKNEDEEYTSTESTNESAMHCWSQNTKNLFTEGAWQLMWEDLPGIIQKRLRRYEIATILHSARNNFLQNLKVEFFAGVLENLQNRNNLVHFTLKDSTGNIPAVVHSDISTKYPDIFCASTVILLHDVTVTRIFQSTHYRVIITPSNILGMYTDKGKMIKTAKFDELLSNS